MLMNVAMWNSGPEFRNTVLVGDVLHPADHEVLHDQRLVGESTAFAVPSNAAVYIGEERHVPGDVPLGVVVGARGEDDS